MDSREGPPPAPPPRQNIMMGPTASYSSGVPTNHHHHHHHPSMIVPNYGSIMQSNPGFPFNSPPPRPQEPVHRPVYDGSSHSQSLRPGGAAVSGSGSGGFAAENARKKRGRPRKYVPDGSIALGLAPAPAPAQVSAPPAANHGNSGNSGGTPSSETQSKRNRGRPPGSGKKQLDALGGTGGVGFTPHVIMVEVGEDIIEKINAFSMQGPRAVCILSANGAICNVTLRQPTIPANVHGTTLTYEGRFEIISLSGSFLVSNTGDHKRGGSLSVSLAGPDGHVVGGGVCGVLLAASPVQVIVGSFIEDGKKTNTNVTKSAASPAAPPQMLSFGGAAVAASSPPSQGGSSGSSDENGSSPTNRGSGLYGNANQPVHSMHMYHQLWSGQTQQ